MHRPATRPLHAWLIAASLVLGITTGAQAAVQGHNTLASFASATASHQPATLFDFDPPGLSLNNTFWSVSGSIAAGGAPQVVSGSGLWTTSGSSFLGSADAGNLGQFSSGDTLTFNFSQPTHAFGLYVITGSDVVPGDLTLQANGHSVSNGLLSQALSDGHGSYAHFLGLVADTFNEGFSTVSLSSNGDFFFVFAADDVRVASLSAVPEPAGALLGAFGLVGLIASTRTRRQSLTHNSR